MDREGTQAAMVEKGGILMSVAVIVWKLWKWTWRGSSHSTGSKKKDLFQLFI